MDPNALDRYRNRWRQDRQRSRLRGAAYVYLDRFGITRIAHDWHFPRRKTIERVSYYLDHACPGWRDRTRHCYFGHSHLPFSNWEHDGIFFHNTGSAIRGMSFNPLFFEIPNHDG
jgi:UDP-2,3-diacylglucosamine hydrolase